jgi:UDP-glucose 4-epimerase
LPPEPIQQRRVLVTGVSSYLGLRLAQRLADEGVHALIGVDLDEPPFAIRGLEFVRAGIESPLISRVIEATGVDTIVHTNISSQPGRFGSRARMKESNVLGTIQLLAAAQHAHRVRRVVVKSSAAVYGVMPGEPSLLSEEHAARGPELLGYARDCAEAETYARDFGRRRPDVNLIILRTQNVIGRAVETSIARYLSLPVIPTAMGYDPRIQLLHEQDAIDALHRALLSDTRGIYNIAGDGVVYLSQAIRMLGRLQLPLVLPIAQGVARALRRRGVVDFPTDQLPVVLFGRVLDTRRATEVLGFSAKWSTEECVADFRDNRQKDSNVGGRLDDAFATDLATFLRAKRAAPESAS